VHVEAAAEQAVAALKAAAAAAGQGLSAAALEALAGLPAWPTRLLQLVPVIMQHTLCCNKNTAGLAAIRAADTGNRVQQLLLAVLGDLEAVWADKQLKDLLLGLPLPAMQLLLSSDQLRVAAEDTVLYTMVMYRTAGRHKCSTSAVRAALAPLLRAPHMSVFALSCYTVSPSSSRLFLSAFEVQLRSLLCLRHMAGPAELEEELAVITGAPPSWRLGPRQLRPLADGVQLQWRLSVEQLKAACRASFAQQEGLDLLCPDLSPPMGGRAWRMLVQCNASPEGTRPVCFVGPHLLPECVFVKSYSYTVTCCGVAYSRTERRAGGQRGIYNGYTGASMCFPAEPLAGGWDDAAWAAAGLPASGDLLLQLHMHSVE
jgi:hypothetical protein